MFNGLAILKTASALAGHASARQAVIARNIANADTPGYVARDLADFREVMAEERLSSVAGGLRTSRSGHLAASHFAEDPGVLETDTPGDASPNGNTVSIEYELVRQADAKRQFDLSLSVYQSGLSLLRTSLGRRCGGSWPN